MTYLDHLTAAMTALGARPETLFLGQAVAYPGTAMTATFSGVPRDRLIELPVFENTQLGMAIGLSLAGYLPVAVYPRINFLLCAMEQLVLHLDALPRYSNYRPRVIIRTAVANEEPLNPGPQHLGDYSREIRAMLRTVDVITLMNAHDVRIAYRSAIESRYSTILVEYARLYGEPT